jgi:peptidoglycan/xylan/chitin deacetylase (PgdA/CDA1 family)
MRTIYRRFPGGRHKALTMSYDDGRAADRRLVEIVNGHGIKGTFHLNDGLMGSGDRIPREEAKSLYPGHEVSGHTMSHPTIARCPIDQVAAQVIDDRRGLEGLVGYPVRGMSYPNGSHSPEIREMLPHLGVEYARIVGSSRRFDLPEDLYRWEATCHHSHDLLALGRQFLDLHKRQYLYLMYVWGHSYEFDNDGNWDLMEEFCRTAGGKDDVWYATNIQIVDCMRAWTNLRFCADGAMVLNPNACSVWLEVGGVMVETPGGAQVPLP